ncbi:putative glycoside hydrolase [Proteinivorax hydrogeniformans]|uniref:Glycoside hydrolase n=1 Tax=Proteinivorax hydrogeniformans TaxID=1826727 RepID=A0AAU8HTG2_9FIRM
MKLTKILLITLVAVLILPACTQSTPPENQDTDLDENGSIENPVEDENQGETEEEKEEKEEPKTPQVSRPEDLKGIYLTGNSVGHPTRFTELIELINDTELNTMVIDVKDDHGDISYLDTEVEFALDIGANKNKVSSMEEAMERLVENDIYPLARVVVFKDGNLGRERPDLAIQDPNGGTWVEGGSNVKWGDPHSEEVWDYVIDVAIEAAELGFQEIQFDYIRFPNKGGLVYPHKEAFIENHLDEDEEYSKSIVIKTFAEYAASRLEEYDVDVTADIFGMIGHTTGDMGIGQHLETLVSAEGLDAIYPMVYPSHYNHNNYGLENNNAHPYETVNYALEEFQERLEEVNSDVEIIPWLQAFTMGEPAYGPEEVRLQIEAGRDLGINDYILWNSGNVYAPYKDALK